MLYVYNICNFAKIQSLEDESIFFFLFLGKYWNAHNFELAIESKATLQDPFKICPMSLCYKPFMKGMSPPSPTLTNLRVIEEGGGGFDFTTWCVVLVLVSWL